MKKKILAITLCVAMVAIMLVSGTLAYFTDTDEVTNVMAVGSVKIEQIEQERGANGALQAFTQDKSVVPAVGPVAWADEAITVGGGTQKVFTEELKNVVDKFVFVKNSGKSDAWIRTIILLEAPGYDAKNLIHVNVNDTEDVEMTNWEPIEINNVQYLYAVFTYTEKIAANGGMTPVSLAQVFLDKETTNEDVVAYGDTWEILALSQAVQSEGFDTAAAGLDEAFGAANAANIAAWLGSDQS